MMRADLEAAKIVKRKRAAVDGDVVRRSLCEPCYLAIIITGDKNSLCPTCRPTLT